MENLTKLSSSGSRLESCKRLSFVKGESVERTKIVTTSLPLWLILTQINYFGMTKKGILTEEETEYAKYFIQSENSYHLRSADPSFERAFDLYNRGLGTSCMEKGYLHRRRVPPPYRCSSRSPEMYCLWNDTLLWINALRNRSLVWPSHCAHTTEAPSHCYKTNTTGCRHIEWVQRSRNGVKQLLELQSVENNTLA